MEHWDEYTDIEIQKYIQEKMHTRRQKNIKNKNKKKDEIHQKKFIKFVKLNL